MSTNKQRREAERARLQRQLEQRRQREASRKRFTTVASIIGALVLVAAMVVIVVVTSSGSKDKPKAKAGGSSAATSSASDQPSASASASTSAAAAPVVPVPTTPCRAAPSGDTAQFAGLTISGATNLKAAPKVTGKASGADPTTLACEDLVVGSGKAATTASQATVEYVGLVYKTGKVFQSSWDSSPATFGLSPQEVIPGFSQGIAGAGKVAPMKVGGRRVILMPASTAYGANPPSGSGIPANAALVFIVDLQKLAA